MLLLPPTLCRLFCARRRLIFSAARLLRVLAIGITGMPLILTRRYLLSPPRCRDAAPYFMPATLYAIFVMLVAAIAATPRRAA